jgi:hypothetical protein
MAEREESPTSSTKNGLTQRWSKSRNRDKKGRDSTSHSLKSSGSDNHLGLLVTVDSSIDKIKVNDEDGEVSGLKKLVPKGLSSKRRRKKQELEEEQRAIEEAMRGRSVADRGTLHNDTEEFEHRDRSKDGSSLTAYDSDTES